MAILPWISSPGQGQQRVARPGRARVKGQQKWAGPGPTRPPDSVSTATHNIRVDGKKPKKKQPMIFNICIQSTLGRHYMCMHTYDTILGTHSKYLQNQSRVPRFWSCNPITGTVRLNLDLDTPQNI